MFTTAEEAAQLIGPYVNKHWPNDKEDLYRLLTLVNDKIWKEGSWHGMTSFFNVRARKGPNDEYYITCPPNYDILKAVNVNEKPVLPRDTWFQFHKNGCGTIDMSCGNWTDTVVDLGEFATINDIYVGDCRPRAIMIGATLTGGEEYSETKQVRIQGEWDRGGEVYTYEKEIFPEDKVEALNEEESIDTVFGAKLALNNKIRYIENIHWKSVTAITKDVTISPVDVYALHYDGTFQLLATIPPHQKYSRYRRYLLPDHICEKLRTCDKNSTCNCDGTCSANCGCEPAVQAMFKVSEPNAITYDTQPVYTRDREALISLAIGMNEMFDKKQPASSIPFTLNGIKNLDDHNRENQSDDVVPVQVTGPYLDDVPEIFRHFSH